MSKEEKMKKCPNCNKLLDRIWFTAQMTEEWSWSGYHWECTAHHSLVADPQHLVICPYCEHEVGTGRNFGFGE